MLKAVLVLLFSLYLIHTSPAFLGDIKAPFNQTLATKFWYLCMGSYCRPSKVSSWDLGFVSDLYPNVTDITLIINSTGNAAGFTAYNPDEDEVLIVFRGTEPLSIKNWIDDIDTFFTDYAGCNGCKVHEGFYHTYLEVRDKILSSAKILFQKYPNSKKLVTGHSLGGALAIHASVDIIQNFGKIDRFYTFGSPRVGNQEFADFVNGMTGKFMSRITHYKDPVPHLPLKAWGFFHIDTEIFFNQDNSGYLVCQVGEDNQCSDAYLDIYVLDHLNYMAKDMTLYYLGCQL